LASAAAATHISVLLVVLYVAAATHVEIDIQRFLSALAVLSTAMSSQAV
jgi:hypothetical protein